MNNRKELISFFIITFAISWGLWLGAVLNTQAFQVPGFLLLFAMFANYGPTLAALILTYKSERKNGVLKLFKSAIDFKLGKIPLLVIFLLPIILTLIPFLVIYQMTTYTSEFLKNPISLMIVFFSMLFTGGPIGEEFGWRGYALPRLLSKMSGFYASLILGFIHGIWHLPLFFIAGTVQSNLPIWEFVAVITLSSFIYTWLYKKTSKRLSSAILFHNMGNLAAWMFPYWQNSLGRYIFFGLNLLVVGVLILKDKELFYSKIVQ